MADQPKPRAFCVTIVFGDGPMASHVLLAPSAEWAAAWTAYQAGRSPEIGAPEITGCSVMALDPEWMRQALRMMKEGKPAGEVVSLVSDNLRPPNDNLRPRTPVSPAEQTGNDALEKRPSLAPDTCLVHGTVMIAGICPLCQPNLGGAA